jgi:hypothetical protein
MFRKAALFGLVFLLLSCLKDKAAMPTDCAYTVSYSEQIVPIINSSCITGLGPGTGCHDAWILEYDGIPPVINNGSLENRCFEIRDMPVMPNEFGIDSLTELEIYDMRCWVEQGFPNN